VSAYIIGRINIEVPEVYDHECFVEEIHSFLRADDWDTQKKIGEHYINVSDPIIGTRDITIELVIHEELFAQAHKVTDALIEKIENYILNKRIIGAWVTSHGLMLGK
jgi:hypothetical protein